MLRSLSNAKLVDCGTCPNEITARATASAGTPHAQRLLPADITCDGFCNKDRAHELSQVQFLAQVSISAVAPLSHFWSPMLRSLTSRLRYFRYQPNTEGKIGRTERLQHSNSERRQNMGGDLGAPHLQCCFSLCTSPILCFANRPTHVSCDVGDDDILFRTLYIPPFLICPQPGPQAGGGGQRLLVDLHG
jgi:hypothetical protein